MYSPKFPDLYQNNRRRMLTLMKHGQVPELMVNDILSLLDDTDFFEAPASTAYHGAEPGGLFEHSEALADNLVVWARAGLIEWERPFSPYVVGYLHDFCKVGKYTLEFSGTAPAGYSYAPKQANFGGHGEDSLCKILLKVPLNEEEAMCIRWHMGAYEKDKWDDFDAAIRKYPNVLWTHHADMVASKILGV